MQLVAGSLIQDLIDVVARVSLLSTASGVTINFSGDTIGGTYPASVMGIMDSGVSVLFPVQRAVLLRNKLF